MARRTVSKDLKARIPVLFLEQGRSVQEICEILGIKKSLAYKTLQYVRDYAVSHNPLAHRSSRPRILSGTVVEYILALLRERPTLYLDEIQYNLAMTHGIAVSLATLVRTLRRMHYSNKAVTKVAHERDDLRRAAFMNRIAEIITDPYMLMFADESAVDKRTSARRRGWAPLASRCVQRVCFVRGQRYSLLPILTLDGIITFKLFEGSVTGERFLEFLREFVVSFGNATYPWLHSHYFQTAPVDYTISRPTQCAGA